MHAALANRTPLLAISLVLVCTIWPFAAGAEAVFRLGVINERPERPSAALEQYGLLHDHLGQRLAGRGIRVGDLVIARDLNEMAALLDSGAVDALFEGVMPTLSLQRRTNRIAPALLVWRKGQRQYHTVFFVRGDSAIRDLQGLRGKTVVFESPRSTSAWFVPRVVLRANGLGLTPSEAGSPDPGSVRYLFAGSELNQAYWVQAGRAEAGAFNDGDWERIPLAIRQDLRLIATTPPVLRWLFSCSTSLEPWIRDAVADVLLAMHQDPDGRAALSAAEHIAKFEPLSAEDRAHLAYWSNLLDASD